MNRFILTTLLWLWMLFTSSAQDATLFNQVIGSTGHVAVQQGLTYAYTVGEAVIVTVGSDKRILSQGFHQPEHTRIVSVGDPDFANWDIHVFPNPVSEVLTIRYSADKGASLTATVVDLVGKVLLQRQPLSDPHGSILDCRSWQPGVYFLILQDPVGRGSSTVRIVRL
ncbi:MAG: T9SS type A sorting domain-containing protein [Saprospiraceae bacterium]|nr:T9SS type A sorting domain-containing protein [Lewinellaceae bacterium]